MNDAMARARWRMQIVLTLRYLHGLTLEETGERLGITRERARQIEALAIKIIRSKPELMAKIRDILAELEAARRLPADLYMGAVVPVRNKGAKK